MKTKLLRRIRKRYFAYINTNKESYFYDGIICSGFRDKGFYRLIDRKKQDEYHFSTHSQMVDHAIANCASWIAIKLHNKMHVARTMAKREKNNKNIL